jgi:molybdate transport system substrate-binding protein
VVSAASSMTEALTACAPGFEQAAVHLSFAGSDELAAQIRQGVKPDVYAAANTKLPRELHEEGLLGAPVEVATNELVLAVPSDSEIHGLGQLAHEDVKVAIGSESVPIGSYTREVLDRLPGATGEAILRRVHSNEPDANGIIGKLIQKAADAGFVYVSDVNATDGALRAIELPQGVRPAVTYAAGVVEGAKRRDEAKAFIDDMIGGRCADALARAGFRRRPT